MNWGGFLKSFTRYFLSFTVLAYVASFIQGIFSDLTGQYVLISTVNGFLDYTASILGLTAENLLAMDPTTITNAEIFTLIFMAIIISMSMIVAWNENKTPRALRLAPNVK